MAEPFLAIIRLFLVECQVHGLVRFLIPFVLDFMEILEPFARLGRRRRTGDEPAIPGHSNVYSAVKRPALRPVATDLSPP